MATASSVGCRVAPHDPTLLSRVEAIADASDRPARALQIQALLQLPRVTDLNGVVALDVVDDLLAELALEMPAKAEWFVRDVVSSPRLCEFHAIPVDQVRDITHRFHYLRSPRTDGRAYGLSTRAGHLIALCVSSPLDVDRLRELIAPLGYSGELTRVVSRVFAFEGAPRNSISYMLSRAALKEQAMGVTNLLTYVNPNMGFTGSSYRASGWDLLGNEPGTKYRYLDGRYTTDRELAARFGRHDDRAYQEHLGSRFAVSAMALEPLLVFHYGLLWSGNPH